MTHDVTLSAAVLAGLFSFLSPCVLPLVPPYLTFIAGTTIEDVAVLRERQARRDIMLAALLFVLGFGTVFVGLGATASAFGRVLRAYLNPLSMLAGVAIILMGLHFLGVFRFALLYREARVSVQKPLGVWGAYIMGLAFAFGWTPCIGPILAAILAVAATQETIGTGALLLAAYSFGLGVPFLFAAAMIEPFIRFMKRFKTYFGIMEKVVGVCLVLTGIAFLTGSLQTISFWLLEKFPALATLG
ncbi:cytochrome c biogenesis CcdA family protein [Beijerinckia indica]|uniref:Cytochrome c biogenesis protein transmembrane region n=1 Tax=Beijerinckia indica subsp. indica (strain ATCC 9039 / DSM 1715 / NCIMB 8712) TaxID=395963 RepID=B2IGS9_BEII9|nr:cytochrome c biogenesis protein CcdA [Beijerinckia indica]ACB95840.1 cytochrome c biogenesis protein transmembrane region [Beijerinckia indica subsp. indica ATCC 9039]